MIGLRRGIVKLEWDWENTWEKEFYKEKKEILSILSDYVIDIQHIGSTAIAGIMAKPIIDIAVGIRDFSDAEEIKDKLIEKGYHYRENAGDDNRIFFAKGNEDNRTHYLHIYKYGSSGWRDHLFFRDYLNTHKEYRQKYNALKLELENLYADDRDTYTNEKESFIMEVLKKKYDSNMINTMNDVKYYSKAYDVSEADIIMIALNAMGVNSSLSQPRLRMQLSLIGKEEEHFYLGIANHKESPFVMKGDKVYFDNIYVANTYDVENDDCASSYFRKDSHVITLNSNRRSGCRGCRFCPNNLELNSEDGNLDTMDKLVSHFKNLMLMKNKDDLSSIERITICTGCFGKEEKALEHILLVNDAIKSLGFKGELHYIGSEIVSEESFNVISKSVNTFRYTFTIECFTKRERMLKDIKSRITLNEYLENIKKCKEYGFSVNIIYVLGLDSLEATLDWLDCFIDFSNALPLINIFQPHVPEHYELLDSDAWRIGYYLTVRKFVENKYKDAGVTSQSWECYRPLWYFWFGKEKMKCIRI